MRKCMIKKAMLVLFALILSMGLFACSFGGSTEKSGSEKESGSEDLNTIGDYLDNGYEEGSVTIENNMLTMLVSNSDKDEYLKIEVPVSDEEVDSFDELDYTDDDYNKRERAFFDELSGELTVTNMKDEIPSDAELKELKGKTCGDLESMGYEQTSVDSDENGKMVIIYSKDDIELMVYPEGDIDNLMELEEVELSELKIAKVKFYDFR